MITGLNPKFSKSDGKNRNKNSLQDRQRVAHPWQLQKKCHCMAHKGPAEVSCQCGGLLADGQKGTPLTITPAEALLHGPQRASMTEAHQQQLQLQSKGAPGTGEQRVLSFLAPEDTFFIKPLLSRLGGTADLFSTKGETQKLRQNEEAEECVLNKRNRIRHQTEG